MDDPSSSLPTDVFLSFRGQDTRENFVCHLHKALERKTLKVYIDKHGLKKGDNLSDLLKAIAESKISIVVFSENYASSTWCLKELVKIMECKAKQKQIVMPIFYRVDPSDIRKQRGSFGQAFAKHERERERKKDKKLLQEVQSWRSTLKEAADLAGWDSKNYQDDGSLIEDIVRKIFDKLLSTTYLTVAVYPVGIESRIKDICNFLSDGKEDDVRMIGIWGMGGSGKSTLARAVYNKFFHSFESKSFLGNVRETAQESNGMITLQKRLLSDILKPTKTGVSNAFQGITVIKERLGSKKVLVIVDDVNDRDQLTALALLDGSFGWRKTFGPGSRIIVTTRDEHLLKQLEVDKIHVTREMKEEEALELFSWHAFHNPCPDSGFSELTGRVVTYCKGLPLALEVLGSFLFDRSQRDWKDTLKNLEEFPDAKIDKILKISFDALEKDQKEIFLHICCFFVGMDKQYVTHILHGCGHSSEVGIGVLLQRCLVTVSERNKLMMHDLLRVMGREVVREESCSKPEERSRLWRQEDAMDVMREESGTKQIEGLALNLQRSDKMRFRSFSTKAFEKMKKLKLLQLSYVQLHGDSEYLPRMLRWLCWRGSSLRTIPKDFLNEQYLVSIDLRYSDLVQFWEQSTLLKKLKILNLSHSHDLTQTPDFSNLPNLKYLILKDCRSLSEIHESIGHLRKLALLNLKDCIMLKDLPKSCYKLKSVNTLVLSGCSRFEDLSNNIGNSMSSLTTLRVNGSAISQVPSSLGGLELNYSSRQDLILVKKRYPDVPRYHLPVLPQGFTSLNMGSSSVHMRPCFSNCTNIPAAIIPSSSNASRQSNSILQGLTATEDGVICLAGNDFPKPFNYVRKSDLVFSQVPQIIRCNLKALTVRVVGSLHFSDDMYPSRNSIIVTNHTKRICFVVRPACPTYITSLHEVIWQGNLSNSQLKLEGGDSLQVEVVAGTGLRVRKTGVSLVWDPNLIIENLVECEPIPYEDFRSDADYQE